MMSKWTLRLFACTLPVALFMAVAEAAELPYDGDTLFRGVFFAAGPVAKLLPEIWRNPEVAAYFEQARPAVPAEQAAASIDQIVGALNAQDPAFFGRFASDMQSGNRVRISQAFQEARERFWRALETSAASNAAPSVWFAPSLQRDVLIDLIARRLKRL